VSIARVNEMTEKVTAWKDKLSKLATSISTKLQVDLNVNRQVRNLTTALVLRMEFLINVSVNFERSIGGNQDVLDRI